MKAIQSWRRNPPSTMSGESITVVTTYTSFDKSEIDELEKMFPKGWMITEMPEGKKNTLLRKIADIQYSRGGFADQLTDYDKGMWDGLEVAWRTIDDTL